ncbi:MAG: DUF3842 family protein [Tissierellia bacterium]|nr:DUF3842 family protein [Tissierellia bacterium]
MKILVIDGQGGKMGRTIVEQLKNSLPDYKITALGTNSIATSAMLKAGADFGATGENPVIYNSSDADIIIGSMGIIVANSYMGEITPAMASAISESHAVKILIPVNRCNIIVAGIEEMPFNEYTSLAVQQVKKIIKDKGK